MAEVVEPIKITGIREFQRALKEMDGESQKRLRVVFNEAAELVAQKAGRKVPILSGRARKSLKPRSSQREARVAAGGRRAPYYPWLDFGGRLPRGQERRYIEGGRYIYPTLSDNHTMIVGILEEALVELAEDAGLKVT